MSASVVLYVSFHIIITISIKLFPRFQYYLQGVYFNGEIRSASIINLILYLSILLFGVISRYGVKTYKDKKEKNNNKVFNKETEKLEMLFLLVGVAIMFLSLKANILDRIAMYFNVYSIVILPNSINKINNKWHRIMLIISTVIILFIYSTTIKIIRPEWQRIFPYTFFWN